MPPLTFTGVVTKVGCMQKTATVTVSRYLVHRKTHKRIERSKKYLTHDPENSLKFGDTVLIKHCRPISARKRFTLDTILKSPETEWQKTHGTGGSSSSASASASLGAEGEPQGPPDVSAGGSVLGALREAKQTSPSKMAQEGMAGVLGGTGTPSLPS
ncbi:hypothetical protein BU17DRAFT_37631 [Hysterangium stoloniferum]|nr:hypothetical protein BU17DRAFT_37631 [Hysterangium stoloniferum]